MAVKSLGGAEMMKFFEAHAAAEFVPDLDLTMSTVSDNPVFEWAALGIRAEGRDAVREMYRRIMESQAPKHILYTRGLAVGENMIAVEYVIEIREPGGADWHTGLMTAVTFDGEKISAERTYSHPNFTGHVLENLGEDFLRYPGVKTLEYASLVPGLARAPWYQPAAQAGK